MDSSSELYGIKLLGVPLGFDSFICTFLSHKLTEVQSQVTTLFNKLGNPHIQWCLLHQCVRTKVNHLFRCLPPRLTYSFAENVDKLLHCDMQTNLNCNIPNLFF